MRRHRINAPLRSIALCSVGIAAMSSLVFSTAPSLAAELFDPSQPLNSRAVVPLMPYESAFRHYTKQSEAPMKSWTDANKTVGDIGGWRVYLKEAQAPEPASSIVPIMPAAPTSSAPTSSSPKPSANNTSTMHKHHQGSKP